MRNSFPASLGQAALWIGDQLTDSGAVRNTCTTLDIDGRVPAQALGAACSSFTAATPAPRLRFGIDPSGSVAQWFDAAPAEVAVLPQSPDPWADPEVEAAIDAAAERRFALDGGALVRFVVAPGRERQRLALIGHHLVIDGACQEAAARRMAAAVTGRCPVEPEPAYRALVETTRRREAEAITEHGPYWEDWVKRCDSRGLFGEDQDAPAARAPGEVRSRIAVAFERDHTAADAGLFRAAVRQSARALREHGWRGPFLAVATSTRPPGGSSRDCVMGYFVNQVPLDVAPGADEQSWREATRRRGFPFARLVAAARAQAARPDLLLDRALLTYRRVPPRVRWTEDGLGFEADLGRPYRGSPTDFSIRVFDFPGGLELQAVLSEQAADRYDGPAVVRTLAEGLRTEAARADRGSTP